MNRKNLTLSAIGLLVAVLSVSVARGTPVSYWQFDSDFTDAMGNNDGSPQGAPPASITSTPGEFTVGTGGLKLVDANQQYVKVDGLSDDFTTGSAFSLTGWFNTTDVPTLYYNNELFSAHTSTAGNVFRVGVNDNGGVFLARAGGADQNFGSGYNDGNWHFLAVTESTTGVAKVKVDNAEITGFAKVSTPWSTATQYSIGQEYDPPSNPGDYFDGFVDDLAVWDRALPDGMIAAMYQGRSPLEFQTIAFQEGVDHGYGVYSGTQDTYLNEGTPTTSLGASSQVGVDAYASPSDATKHGLVRFENILGSGPGRIPNGVEIVSAELVITTPNDSFADGNGAYLYRLLVDWDESDTWNNSFGGDGIDADGIEAMAAIEVDTGLMKDPRPFVSSFDVTESVKAWHAGTADNYGWAFLPRAADNPQDAWLFASSERSTPGFRPMLLVTYHVPEPSACVLLGLGVLGLVLCRLRGRRSAV